MSSKAIPSAIAALGINAIPVAVVLLGGQSVETAMILYFLENILAILFCAARVRVLAPARDEAYGSAAQNFAQLKVNDRIVFRRRPPADRGALLSGYLLASLGLSLGTAVFMAIFLFLILDMSLSRTAIVAGMAGIAVFQVFNFVADLFLLDSLSPGQAEMLLKRSMGRVAFLHLAVILGIMLALVVESWFVVPFAVLKTIADLAAPELRTGIEA